MVLNAWRDGWRRVRHAPAVLFGTLVLTLAAGAPLALTLHDAIEDHLGRSLAAESAADGVNFDWWQEFLSVASGVAGTLSPAVVGFAAALDGLSSVLDGRAPARPLLGAVAAYLLAWTFLSGGILDRYARQRPTRSAGFFAASGMFFWRFLRLMVVSAGLYYFLFATVHPWLLDDAYGRLTRDASAERTALAWRLVLYAVFGLVLMAVSIVLDYTRIRIVVEDRRSVLGAIRAACAFLLRHPGRACGLYALNSLAFLALLTVWGFAAPGVSSAGVWMWAAFAGAQGYILARIGLRLQFMASQTALFQSSLAHAGYAAAPEPVWPESAAVEQIGQANR
jgi:hypothetical protein